MKHIAANLRAIQDRIARACESVGRDPSTVTLVAVSKTFPIEAVRAAYDLGLRHFGESRLQEALPKLDAMPTDITWHFIGALQSNKARKIGERFDVVHTLGSESALKELAKSSRRVTTLIEVNIGDESQKAGISQKDLDAFHQVVLHYAQVDLRGLMTIGPVLEPEQMRPLFREIREEADRRKLPWASMGMSQDFEVAIQEGSTHIRVGSALFGTRG